MAIEHILQKRKMALAALRAAEMELQEALKPHMDSGGILNTVSNILGTSANYNNPNLTNGTSQAQLDQGYQQSQAGLASQTALANQAAAQGGFGTQNAELASQQGLQNTLTNEANGNFGSANLAQATLNNATGQNVANTAAAMAGARGSSGNVGLMARQIGLQGANIYQQAVGQAATNAASQQLNAQNALAAQQNNIQNVAGNQISTAANTANSASTAAQNLYNTQQNANTAYNQAQLANSANQLQASEANQQQNSSMLGGILGGASSLIGSIFAHGGVVHELPKILAQFHEPSKAKIKDGVHSIHGRYCSGGNIPLPYDEGGSVGAKLVPVVLSPGEVVLTPEQARARDAGRLAARAHEVPTGQVKMGGRVGGHATVKGDSLKNDKVDTELAAGSVVVPRSKSRDEGAAQKFIEAVLAKKKGKVA